MKNSHRTSLPLDPLDSLERGGESEARVAEVLRQMKFRGEIHEFIWNESRGKLDNNALDFLVILPESANYGLVGLQVKSSEAGRMKHMAGQFWYIPCVIVTRDDDNGLLAEKVRSALSISVTSLVEELVSPDHIA